MVHVRGGGQGPGIASTPAFEVPWALRCERVLSLQCTATENDDNHRVCQFTKVILHGGTVYYLTDGERNGLAARFAALPAARALARPACPQTSVAWCAALKK